MRAHVAISKHPDPVEAARAVAGNTRAAFKGDGIDLGFLFYTPHYRKQDDQLLNTVRAEIGIGLLLGCMGDGVIGGDEEVEDAPAVVLWCANLPDSTLVPLRLSFSRDSAGVAMGGWPETFGTGNHTPFFVLLADPFTTPVDAVLAHVDRTCPRSPAIGGMASGGNEPGENRLLLDGAVYEDGVVGVAMVGSTPVRTVVSQGCRPISDRYVVTKADRNVIYELGGVPPLERLQTVIASLGENQERNTGLALHLGVAIDEYRERFERGDFVIRGVMGAERNSGGLVVTDVVKEGQTVQFQLRDPNAASEDLNLLLAEERLKHGDLRPKGALLFSCNGRGRRFFSSSNHDVSAVSTRMGGIPIAGFFAQGEIGPIGGHNFLHGYTASVALFSESPASQSPAR